MGATATGRRVLLVYNTDYDEELKRVANADESAVQLAAQAVQDAVGACGHQTELLGVAGPDIATFLEQLRANPPELVFNLCESLCGDTRNEMLMPGLLDMFAIPYTGPAALSIASCLHKDRTKEILNARGVPTPEYVVIRRLADVDHLPGDFAFPAFVKLSREDASIGISSESMVRDREALRRRAAALLEQYKQPLIAERFIAGREVNVTVLGNDPHLECLPFHEIDFSDMPAGSPHIVTYAAKWEESHPEYNGTKPVPLENVEPEVTRAIGAVAIAAFQAMGLRDFGRVDLRIDDAGQPWVIDVNPNCDLSPDAGVAKAARCAGLEYPDLIGRICEIAWRRHAL